MDLEIPLQLVTILIMVLGIIIAIRQLGILTTQIRNQYEWSRRQGALAYSLTKSERLREARINLDTAFGILGNKNEALTLQEIDTAIEKKPSIYTDIIYLLAHWENLALAIHSKVVDETVAFEMVAGMVITYVKEFRNFIEKRRKENPRAYDYLLDLTSRWEDRLSQIKKPLFSDLRDV